VRHYVASRSASQRVGVVAVVALLLTAPFGGLRSNDSGLYSRLQLGHRYDLGLFYLTIDKVETLSDLSPAVKVKKKGDRIFVVEYTVTNRTDEPVGMNQVIDAVGADHTGGVPWSDDVADALQFGSPPPTEPEPRLFNVADASDMSDEVVNPGIDYQVAEVIEQGPGWDPDDLVVYLNGYTLHEDDPTTFESGHHWVEDRLVAKGHVDAEIKG
jgi:hypothetical protein